MFARRFFALLLGRRLAVALDQDAAALAIGEQAGATFIRRGLLRDIVLTARTVEFTA
jgi:hypothetical protein